MSFNQINRTSIFIIALLVIMQVLSCTSYEKITTGVVAMERKQYAVAQQLLLDEISRARGSEKAKKMFLLGESYRMTNQAEQALKWYLKTIELGLENDEIWWWTGMMYKQTGQYLKSIGYLEKVDKNTLIGLDASRETDICRQALNWIKRENSPYKVSLNEGQGNGTFYLNGIYEDGRLLVTSDHDNRKKSYKWTGRYYSAPLLMDPEDGGLNQIPEISRTQDQWGYISYNSNFTEMIFTLCKTEEVDEGFCKLYSRKKVKGEWMPKTLLDFIQPEINYSHPFLTRDSILFFISNDMKGKGGYDLYYSIKKGRTWGDPVNLPAPINTPGNEKFPTIFNDTLYFSSDYLPGLGGLDIFKTYVRENGQWAPPRNMMPPLNSPKDDFGLILIDKKNREDHLGYINSSRDNEQGLDRIFSVYSKPIIKQQEITSGDTIDIAPKQFKRFLALRVVEQVFEDSNDPNSRVIGKKPIDKARGSFLNSKTSFTTKNNGRYITEISFDSSYTIRIEKNGYLTKTITVPELELTFSLEDEEIQTSSIEVVLQKPFINQEVVLQNIYYDLDKWYIREDAKPVLNQLALDLRDNPGFNVMIASHTDCRADETYNFDLSEKRARAVVDYLVTKGIDKSRLSFIGYGKSKLVVECPCESCTEDQHQKNRRTTFTLLDN